jgi:hypothetical protein
MNTSVQTRATNRRGEAVGTDGRRRIATGRWYATAVPRTRTSVMRFSEGFSFWILQTSSRHHHIFFALCGVYHCQMEKSDLSQTSLSDDKFG